MNDRLTVEAPAKINLSLSIVGRRPDGYHLLETLMAKLSLADRLTLDLGGRGIQLQVTGADLPADADNLVYRAAMLFFERSKISPGVAVHLEKRIPVAAGLGGGSSDAAAALWGLNRLCGEPFSLEQLEAMGLELGADVPFFVNRNSVLMATGIGEVLEPAALNGRLWVLLINPGWPLNTAGVYKKFNFELTKKRQKHIFCGLLGHSFQGRKCWNNDLELVVLPRFPELDQIKDLLIGAGAEIAQMTGSGPTMFGIFPDEMGLKAARVQIEEAGRDKKWLVVPTRTIE